MDLLPLAGLSSVASYSAAWGDYDNDGDLDLTLDSALYRNTGGNFVNVTSTVGLTGFGAAGMPSSWADVDADGDLDLMAGASKVYLNNGGTFTLASGMGLSGNLNGVGWADYDADGDMDVYVDGYSGVQDLLWRNNTMTTRKWLDVVLDNAIGGAAGFGAQVDLFDGTTHARVATRYLEAGLGTSSGGAQPTVRFAGLDDSINYDVRVTYNNGGVKTVVTDGDASYDVAGATMQTNAAYGGIDVGSTTGEVRAVVLTTESGTNTNGSALLMGTTLADRIHGDAGNDVIRGNGGNDIIDLSAGGNDKLQYNIINSSTAGNGGNGQDTLTGFTIADFLTGGSNGDQIDLSNLSTGTPVDTGTVAISGTSARDAGSFVRLDLDTTTHQATLFTDADGGGDGFVQLATFVDSSNAASAQSLLDAMLTNKNLLL